MRPRRHTGEDFPMDADPTQEIRSAADLLVALVKWSDHHGRYDCLPWCLMRLAWWQDDLTVEDITRWRDELVIQGLIEITHTGYNCYDGAVDEIVLVNRKQYPRFKARPAIPLDVKQVVRERDENRCVYCGDVDDLQFDHIHPYSKGGPDTVENLQLLCRSCNMAKGVSCPG